jgi:predicted HTH transcriptional regulator
MTTQLDLLEPRYPHTPGYRRTETSRSAAKQVRSAQEVHAEILRWLGATMPKTPDEIAWDLDMDRHSVRSRCSELKALGKIKPTGLRRPNASGKMADVLGVCQ